MLPMTTFEFLTAENDYRHSPADRALGEARHASPVHPRHRLGTGRTRRALRRTVERLS